MLKVRSLDILGRELIARLTIFCCILLGQYFLLRGKKTSTELRALQMSHLRFAFCITGPIRSLVRTDTRLQQQVALFSPLQGAHLDTFLNFEPDIALEDPRFVKLLKEWYRPRSFIIRSYDCANSTICEREDCHSNLSAGSRMFEQNSRVRDCARAIQDEERAQGMKYNFVIRVRPDLEFYETLPPLKCWSHLPSDVIWDMDTRFRVNDHHTKSEIFPAKEVEFMGDWLTVIPGGMAVEFLSSPYEQIRDCVPLKERVEQAHPLRCGVDNHYWNFPECRFHIAAQLLEARVGKLLIENVAMNTRYTPHTILRCKNDDCSVVQRMGGPRFCEERQCEYPDVEVEAIGKNLKLRKQCFHGF